jgi:phospholipid-transporting ATPase
MTLNEELGQISHIFSDKTGTLTCNNMNFRKFSVNGVQYGQGITEIGRAAWKLMEKEVPPEVIAAELKASQAAVPHVAFYDAEYERIMSTKNRDKDDVHLFGNAATDRHGADHMDATPPKMFGEAKQRFKIAEFFRFIAVCHEAIAEKLVEGGTKLSAPNPDDEALVCAAEYFGQKFEDRRDNFVLIRDRDTNIVQEVEVMYSIDFTSARKRMSVIIRDIDGKVKIITKGADSMMFTRVDPADAFLISKTAEDVDQFSVEVGMGVL